MTKQDELPMEAELGIFPNMSRAAYEAIPAARYSILKEMRRSEAHAYEAMTHPKEQTKAMRLGEALHACILEPDRFDREFVVAPKVDRRTKIGKAAWSKFTEENAGKEFVEQAAADQFRGMVRACWDHPTLSALLGGRGANEVAVVWIDPETGVRCKALIDRITEHRGHTIVLDLKKTTNASHGKFRRDAANYGYHIQAAHYLGGLETINPRPRRSVIAAIEDLPPYGIGLYEFDADSIRDGGVLVADALARYRNCEASGEWPSYSEEIETLRLPEWALKDRDYE